MSSLHLQAGKSLKMGSQCCYKNTPGKRCRWVTITGHWQQSFQGCKALSSDCYLPYTHTTGYTQEIIYDLLWGIWYNNSILLVLKWQNHVWKPFKNGVYTKDEKDTAVFPYITSPFCFLLADENSNKIIHVPGPCSYFGKCRTICRTGIQF